MADASTVCIAEEHRAVAIMDDVDTLGWCRQPMTLKVVDGIVSFSFTVLSGRNKPSDWEFAPLFQGETRE